MANQIESFQQMTLRTRPKTVEVSTLMRSLCSGWRNNRRPVGRISLG
jgi:wyosine [tRNA(Phe)-imidazoG37] synthetase (radical SAM superfamily)